MDYYAEVIKILFYSYIGLFWYFLLSAGNTQALKTELRNQRHSISINDEALFYSDESEIMKAALTAELPKEVTCEVRRT